MLLKMFKSTLAILSMWSCEKITMETRITDGKIKKNSNETNCNFISSLLLLLTGYGGNTSDSSYEQITQKKTKEMMDTEKVIILDARKRDEYDSGHIPSAVLLPVGTIDEGTAAEVIP